MGFSKSVLTKNNQKQQNLRGWEQMSLRVVWKVFYFYLRYLSILIVPLQAQIDTLWTRSFQGDYGLDAIEAHDGGYLIVGKGLDEGGWYYDAYFAKVDSDGNLEWLKSYDGGGGGDDAALALCEAQDSSGYYVVGHWQANDIWLLKLDEDGDTLWTRHYGDPATWDVGTDIRPTGDGNYVIFGNTASWGGPGRRDFFLMKVDPEGNVLWKRLYGTDGSEDAYGMRVTRDGGFILAGQAYIWDFYHYDDYYVVRVDSLGNQIWANTYGGENAQEGRDVCETKDGGYAVIGYSTTHGPDFENPWLLKLDSLGGVMWSRAYHIEGSSGWGAKAWSILETDEGDLVMVGDFDDTLGSSDLFILKVDSLGNPLWTLTLGSGEWGWHWGYSIRKTSDDGYIIAGEKGYSMWLIKTTPDTGMVVSEGVSVEVPGISLNPTISRGVFWLDLRGLNGRIFYEIYDVVGREVLNGNIEVSDVGRFRLDLSHLSSGVYFIKLKVSGVNLKGKLLISR